MALSLVEIGELKSLAGADAKAVLQMLLDRRAARLTVTLEDMDNVRLASLIRYTEDRGITAVNDRAKVNEIGEFYAKEFDRELGSLWDVLMAATRKGAI